MYKRIIQEIIGFYRESDKPSLLFALFIGNQICGFTPGMPTIPLYAIIIMYAVYCLTKNNGIVTTMALFLAYIPIEIILTQPDGVFKAWERCFVFILLMICVSPLLKGNFQKYRRQSVLKASLYLCTLLGAGSFFARFFGINYMYVGYDDIATGVGLFGGLTVHSMLLGPIAGVGAVYSLYKAYKTKNKYLWCIAIMCIGSVLFSASRASLIATIAGCVITFYKASGSTSGFVKSIVVSTMLASLTFPLWNSALDGVIEKNNNNIESGSMYSSREDKWENRMDEFVSSPIVGVGFVSAGSPSSEDFNNGVFENGSSWLSIFSMLGLIGGVLVVTILLEALKSVWYVKQTSDAPIIAGLLVLFFVHMIAEGYIFFAGSYLCFLLWVIVGVANDYKYATSRHMAL